MNTIFVTTISALSVYLLPFLTGRLIMQTFKQKSGGAYYPIISFAIGSLLMYVFVILVYGLIGYSRLIFIAFGLMIALLNIFFLRSVLGDWIRKHLSTIFLVGLVSVIAFTLWKTDNTYPYPLNWDIYEHQTLVNEMKEGKFSVIPSQVSDTFRFDGYTTLFHALVGVPQIIFEPDVLGFWWIVEFLHLVTTVSAIYALAYAVTGKPMTAAISALLGAFVFESYIAYASLFLVPQTMTAVFFIFLIAYLFERPEAVHQLNAVTLVIWTITGLMLHAIVAAAAVCLMAVIYIYHRFQIGKKLFIYALVWAGLTAGLFVGLNMIGSRLPMTTVNYGEAASYVHTWTQKTEYLRVFSGWLVYILLPLGAVLTFAKGTQKERTALLITSLILVVVATQLPYVFKFYVLGRYLVYVMMAIVVSWVFTRVTVPVLRVVLSTTLLATLATLLILNARYWKDFVRYQNQATLVSDFEIEAAKFLKNTYSGKDTLIVSDPATAYVLEAVSGINSPGGAYMNQRNRELVNSVLGAENQDSFTANIFAIADTKATPPRTFILALSGRTYQWYKNEDANKYNLSFNIFTPRKLPLGALSYAENVNQYGGQIVFANREIILFEIRRDI